MIKQFRTIKTIVEQILVQHPSARDNDRELMLKLWARQDPRLKDYDNCLFKTFALDFYQGKYSSPESIRRVRQKLQEDNPKLRGKLWKERHSQGDEVRQGIMDL